MDPVAPVLLTGAGFRGLANISQKGVHPHTLGDNDPSTYTTPHDVPSVF